MRRVGFAVRRGEETEPRRARGWPRKNWVLQTHRCPAATAPAPGEMLMASVDSGASLAEGNLVPPRPAVSIGSAQSAVPSAASSSLPLPPLSPRLLYHRPRGLGSAPRGLGGVRELSLRDTERSQFGNGERVPAQDWPPGTSRMDGHWGSFTGNSREDTGVTSTHNSILPSDC